MLISNEHNRCFFLLSVQQQQKWIKDGRGDGELSSYKPWLTVRDLSSLGRSHRVYGHKTKRTHHLLSDLELAIFLILEWNPLILDSIVDNQPL